MANKSLNDLGRLQRVVLDILWELREGTVHDVRERLKGRRLAYTTVLSVLQKLEAGQWVTHRRAGRSYVYRPKQNRAQAGAASVRQFVQRVFAGDAAAVMQHLVRDGQLNESELRELRELIENKRKTSYRQSSMK